MATISFLVNGTTAQQQTKPVAWVTIEEMANGSLFFKVKQAGGSMKNLHGVYFDIADESITNTLRVIAVSNDVKVSEEEVSYLKNGTDTSEALVSSQSCSADQNATNNYSFTLRSTGRALSLSDFPQIQLDYSGNGGDGNGKTNDDFSHRWLYLGLF
ncbi:MAG: hypothetical protein HRU78_05955 [Gammaproteobacteria bacterium]|nr:MAG: hypothetical protein HRU78_05955 [Gammaproteobacteria bacterium]